MHAGPPTLSTNAHAPDTLRVYVRNVRNAAVNGGKGGRGGGVKVFSVYRIRKVCGGVEKTTRMALKRSDDSKVSPPLPLTASAYFRDQTF